MAKILCFGDSLTFGSIGHSYIKYLKKNDDVITINKGFNGDTTEFMYRRLKYYLSKDNHKGIDKCIVCIGTNDLLLPFLKTVSKSWYFLMNERIKLMNCLINDEIFKKRYEDIIKLLKHYNIETIILGLPHLELLDFPNNLIDNRNKIIKSIGKKYSINYVDVVAIQNKISKEIKNTYSWEHKNLLIFLEGLYLPVFPSLKDYISNKRNLIFTVDGAHWNSVMASRVSNEIEKIVNNK